MQEADINRLICHYCKAVLSTSLLVSCKISGCGLFFCHRCLVSKYKYSKAKAITLPTPHWKCPVCGNRCKCESCKEGGVKFIIKKGLSEDTKYILYKRRKRGLVMNRRCSSYFDFNLRTPLIGEGMQEPEETQESVSPKPKTLLPSLSGKG